MSFISDIPEEEVRYNGIKFVVNPAFDTVLEIQNLYREENLSELDKLNQTLGMLVAKKRYKLGKLNIPQRFELLKMIYKNCVDIPKGASSRKRIPLVDFELDGEYIYASFYKDYGIDLIAMQGILSWRKFISLFQGLSKDTKIREVMHIRDMEIPAYNGKNSKEIAELQELKSYYMLPAKGGGGEAGLDMLFKALEGMTEK